MSRTSPRAQRVADQIRRVLADLIMREMRDPRLGLVSITSVDVSRDFAYASVYVTVMGRNGAGAVEGAGEEPDRNEIEANLAILNKAAGYLRGLLGRELSLRNTPALKFRYDESVARGRYLSSLIDKAIAEDSLHSDSDEAGTLDRDGEH